MTKQPLVPASVFLVGLVLLLALVPNLCDGLDNRVALTPPMGFNNYMVRSRFKGARGLLRIADFFESSGLKELGYAFLNTDEGWELPNRSSTGELQENPGLFPRGMISFIDELHRRGFRFGIYGAASAVTCGVLPGQLHHEGRDARTYANWGVDYVKSDNCANYALDPSVRFRACRDALNATGRHMVYSIEPFSITPDPAVSSQLANLWRTGNDIHGNFHSILHSVDVADKWAPLAGPRLGWNDPDMIHLQNPPGLTLGQNRIHFGLWAIIKAPLLLSSDLFQLEEDVVQIMANPEVVAINQDPLGIAARKLQIDEMPLPWLVGSVDCAAASHQRARPVARGAGHSPQAGPGAVDVRQWDLWTIDDYNRQRRISMTDAYGPVHTSNSTVLIRNGASGRCLAVLNTTRVVLLPCERDETFFWTFENGITTVTAITNVHTGMALALEESFLYARKHGEDQENVTDLSYGTNRLILVDFGKNGSSCDSRYCQNYDPKQLWYYSFTDQTIQHSLYTAPMNHVEDYRDKTHENGWALTPKVPTFRRNCMAHVLSEGNIGTEAGVTEVWGGPLAGGDLVVALVNRGASPATVTARTDLLAETSGMESARLLRIRRLWERRDLDVEEALDDKGNVCLTVPSQDVVLLRLKVSQGGVKSLHSTLQSFAGHDA